MKKRTLKKWIRKTEKIIAEEIFNFPKNFEAENQDEFEPNRIGVLFAVLLSQHLYFSKWDSKERWIDGLINGKLTLKLPDMLLLKSEMVWGLVADVGGKQWREPFEVVAKISPNGKKLNSYTIQFANTESIEKKEIILGVYSGISIIEIFNKNGALLKNHQTEMPLFENYSGKFSFKFSSFKNK